MIMDFEKIFSGLLKDPAKAGAAAIIVAAILWGIDGVALQPNLYNLDVVVVVFLEHALAFVFMIPLLIKEASQLKKLHNKDFLAFAWVALFGGAIGTMAITQALFLVNFIPLSVPILIQKIQPVFAIIMAVFLLGEKPPEKFYHYAVAALAGSYLITFGFDAPVIDLANKTLQAALLGLLAAFAFGSSTTVGRYAVKKVSAGMATYLRFGLTAAVMLAIMLSFGKEGGIMAVSQFQWMILLLIVFTTGGLAMMIYYFGLKRVPASKATLYELAFPFTAIVLDYALHGKFLSAGQILGAVLLLWAVISLERVKVSGATTAPA